MTDEQTEFDLIKRLFAPLASGRPEALFLEDDAAVLSPDSHYQRIATMDCLVAGVHFRTEDPPETVAARSLRTNLSDLAAMGAEPDCYLLALAIPQGCNVTWLEAFARQLGKDQKKYGIGLIGGDTVSTHGPMTVTITALGKTPIDGAIKRSTARAGDDVYVSGCIGDASLGLAILKGELSGIPQQDADYLAERFWYPSPRTTLGPALRDTATAMADVSDGLAADLGHICTASGVSARIFTDNIPLSEPARKIIATTSKPKQASLTDLYSGGDDYELVFTAAPSASRQILGMAKETETPVTRIGVVEKARETKGSFPVSLLDQNGTPIPLSRSSGGYEHIW